jgi:hypothetical protein
MAAWVTAVSQAPPVHFCSIMLHGDDALYLFVLDLRSACNHYQSPRANMMAVCTWAVVCIGSQPPVQREIFNAFIIDAV